MTLSVYKSFTFHTVVIQRGETMLQPEAIAGITFGVTSTIVAVVGLYLQYRNSAKQGQ